MKELSLIITAFNEPNTIGKALVQIADPNHSNYKHRLEVIQISPDEQTLAAGKKTMAEIDNPEVNFLQIKDDNLGKPHALNKALKSTKNEIVILTDGDVYFEDGALACLINEFNSQNLDAGCGNVLSVNSTNSFMGYISHMMTSAAHHKRMLELNRVKEGYGSKLVEKKNFFPLTGYMLIFDKGKLERELGEGFVFPTDCLVDDAYLSYVMFNYGLKLGYILEAKVMVKFPSHLNDYIKQKKRSTGGYIQLWKYGVVKNETKSRSFWHELRYFWFPIKFAFSENSSSGDSLIFTKLFWSFIFFPIRLYLWLQIWWSQKIRKIDFAKTWVRIESTK